MEDNTGKRREEFLRQAQIAVLATVDGHARPHAMPIWYLYEDGVIIIGAGNGSQKHRNLERNPWATLVVDRREPPYYALMVRGKVELGPRLDRGQWLRMATRYLGEDGANRYVESMDSASEEISIRLTPETWIEFRE